MIYQCPLLTIKPNFNSDSCTFFKNSHQLLISITSPRTGRSHKRKCRGKYQALGLTSMPSTFGNAIALLATQCDNIHTHACARTHFLNPQYKSLNKSPWLPLPEAKPLVHCILKAILNSYPIPTTIKRHRDKSLTRA